MAQHADILARFSRDFGVPFLRGDKCFVHKPLGPDGLAALKPGVVIDTDITDAVEGLWQDAALFADVTPAPFDEDAATLLWAVHEWFASVHPRTATFPGSALQALRLATTTVRALPHTLDASRVLTRHLVVGRAFATTRADISLRWWTGNAQFYGAEPPKRLTRWPSLRRVQSDRIVTPLWKLAVSTGDDELRVARTALLVALLDLSPLSRVLMLGDPAQQTLGFSLVLPYKIDGRTCTPLDVLAHRPLARAVVDALVARGVELTGPTIALTLLQHLREGTSPRVLKRAAELCTHMAFLCCLVAAENPKAREARALMSLVEGKGGANAEHIPENMRAYWAVVGAVCALRGVVFAPPARTDLPLRAAEMWDRMMAAINHPRVRAVQEPLTRELSRRLLQPSPPPAQSPRPG